MVIIDGIGEATDGGMMPTIVRERFRIHCLHCMTTGAAELKGSYRRPGERGEPDERIVLCECPNCFKPLLQHMYEVGVDENDALIYSNATLLYPPAPASDPSWPDLVARRFAEAEQCVRASAYNATAVMCRRTMEQVCLELGVNEKTLVKSLEKLKQQGLLDDRLLQWAQSLRAIGNVGAHAGSEDVDRHDAHDVVEFARALIDYVFTYQKRFNAFQARRAAAQQAAQAKAAAAQGQAAPGDDASD